MAKKKTQPTPEPAPKLTIALPPLVEPETPAHDGETLSESVDDIRSFMSAPKKPVNKPDISRLPDGVVDGAPRFRVGDRVVIERYAPMFADRPYLDTRTWYVNDVDLETGRVKLFDEALMQHGTANWKNGASVFKLALNGSVSTKRKRGRPRKNPLEAPKPEAKPGEKKKRGRPAGSKNRPKEVIAEERKVKKLAKAAAVAAKKRK